MIFEVFVCEEPILALGLIRYLGGSAEIAACNVIVTEVRRRADGRWEAEYVAHPSWECLVAVEARCHPSCDWREVWRSADHPTRPVRWVDPEHACCAQCAREHGHDSCDPNAPDVFGRDEHGDRRPHRYLSVHE